MYRKEREREREREGAEITWEKNRIEEKKRLKEASQSNLFVQ